MVFAGNLAGRGVVSVGHTDGLRTTYEPLERAVSRGERVQRGQVIGYLVEGHCEVGCLHFGARTGPDAYIDPLTLFTHAAVRLVPVDTPVHTGQAGGSFLLDLRLADGPV